MSKLVTTEHLKTVQNAAKEYVDGFAPERATFTIPATAASWVLDSEEISDYKWHFDLTVQNATATDIAFVTIHRSGMESARRCGLCPQSETMEGKIRLRSMAVPPSSIAAEYYIGHCREEGSE